MQVSGCFLLFLKWRGHSGSVFLKQQNTQPASMLHNLFNNLWPIFQLKWQVRMYWNGIG